MSTLDRYILRSLAFNYGLALAVMMSLYVLLDMFVNMDEFTEHGYPLATVLANIFSYYAPQVFLYFAQLSGVITLFACAATIARMRRMHELTALLSSGVSLYRVAVPVIAFGAATTGLLVLDTEWLIPAVAHKLARDHDDVDGRRAYEVLFLRDRGGALFSAGRFHPTTRDLQHLLILRRDSAGALVETIEADRASWEAPPSPGAPGRWHLVRGRARSRALAPESALGPKEGLREHYPEWYESDLSPEVIQLRQAEGWLKFLSLSQLRALAAAGTADANEILRSHHARVTAPILAVVMLLLGAPFILNRAPDTVLTDVGKCILACGSCYVVAFIGQSIRLESVSALPFWLPIFVFGTLAVTLLDRIRT
jgi:lipopolysaccharide export LptBFGC system permease protein LptF